MFLRKIATVVALTTLVLVPGQDVEHPMAV